MNLDLHNVQKMKLKTQKRPSRVQFSCPDNRVGWELTQRKKIKRF